MIGTEKQIAWAKDIKATYMSMMQKEIDFLEAIKATGSARDVQEDLTARVFTEEYHPTCTFDAVKNEMKKSDLYKAFISTESGTPERKKAGKAFRTAVATEALRRLTAEIKEKASEESAAKWIEERMH